MGLEPRSDKTEAASPGARSIILLGSLIKYYDFRAECYIPISIANIERHLLSYIYILSMPINYYMWYVYLALLLVSCITASGLTCYLSVYMHWKCRIGLVMEDFQYLPPKVGKYTPDRRV